MMALQPQDFTEARDSFTSALLRPNASAPVILPKDATHFAKAILDACNVSENTYIKVCLNLTLCVLHLKNEELIFELF